MYANQSTTARHSLDVSFFSFSLTKYFTLFLMVGIRLDQYDSTYFHERQRPLNYPVQHVLQVDSNCQSSNHSFI